MTARPRGHGGDDDSEPRPSPRPGRRPASVAEAEQLVLEAVQRGQAGGDRRRDAATRTPDDPELARAMRVYDQLGPVPPKIDVADNDAAHARAHTLERHGPDVPLRRRAGVKTIEGRIYGEGWRQAENQSFKWDDPTIMTREINDYVQQNWDTIRGDLAIDGVHEGRFDAGHRVGEGFLNSGMYGLGPRQAEYLPTSLVRLRIRLVPGADPARPFLISAFPAGIL